MQKASLADGCFSSRSQMLGVYPPLAPRRSTTEHCNCRHAGEAHPSLLCGETAATRQRAATRGPGDRDGAGQKKQAR